MNNYGIPDDKLNALLQVAGNKLGRDPAELRAELEGGKLDNLLAGMDPKSAGQINSLMQNPKAVETLLQNDKIRNLLNGLMGGNGTK